jgi:hypothetical protein
MKKIIITLTILLCNIYIATGQIYFGANGGYNYTKFYNASDANADTRQDYVNTYKPMFGLEIGMKYNNRVAIGIAPQLFTIAQKYTGTPDTFTYIKAFNASLQLNYIRLPLYIQLHLSAPANKVSHFVQFGPSISFLTSSKETYNELNNPVAANDYLKNVQQIFTDKQFYFQTTRIVNTKDSTQSATYNISNGLINKLDFGLNIGYGIQYKISPTINCNVLFHAIYGLANIENADTINIMDVQTGSIVAPFTIKEYRHSRYNKEYRSTDQPRSTKSNNIAMGIQVGITFNLSNGRQQKK